MRQYRCECGAQIEDRPGTIEVTGEATITAEPDIAIVNLGVTAKHKKAQMAMEEVSVAAREMLELLREHGVDGRDIQTQRLELNKDFFWHLQQRKLKNAAKAQLFEAANKITVKVRDLNKLGTIMQAALDAGANSVSNVQFGVDETEKLEAEARSAAASDAHARAKLYAEGVGVVLGRIVSIREHSARRPRFDDDSLVMMRMSDSSETPEVPVASGTVVFSASVNLTCELKQ